MAEITGPINAAAIDLYSTSTTQQHLLGSLAWDANTGKAFRYALVGGSTLVTGNLLQAMVQDTQFENMVVGTAGVAGDKFIQVTNGSTTVVASAYIGGQILVYTAGTVAIGDEYTIIGVTGTLTTGGAMQVYTDKPLRAAFTTSARVVMKKATTSGVIQFPVTTQTEIPVGVALTAATNATYTWIQTHGPCAVLSDNSTFAVGSQLSPSLAVAGAVGVNVAGTTHGIVGWARMAAASAHAIPAFLQID